MSQEPAAASVSDAARDQSDCSGDIDARKQVGARDPRTSCGCRHPEFGRSDIRPATKQIGGRSNRQRWRVERHRWCSRNLQRIGRTGGEGRQPIARPFDPMQRHREAGGEFLLDLLDAKQVQSRDTACADQRPRDRHLVTCTSLQPFDQRDVALCSAQLEVRGRDLRGDRDLRWAHIHRRDTRVSHRCASDPS
jgi:hypothetical protein